jgi:hypothetical protein
MVRAMMSLPPPGAAWTTNSTGFDGTHPAVAASLTEVNRNIPPTIIAHVIHLVLIFSPPKINYAHHSVPGTMPVADV